MGSKLCLQKNSALSKQLKKSVLVAEVSRRLQNCDPMTDHDVKIDILNQFDAKLRRSGYRRDERRRVISDGYVGYSRKIERLQSQGKPTHRGGHEGGNVRAVNKLKLKKTGYFKRSQARQDQSKRLWGLW